MARNKFSAPTLKVRITLEDWETAKQSASGGCLIADAIKRQYPHLSAVSVDMATIRATDKKKGLRYMWLSQDAAKMLLLAYDQGWEQTTEELTIRGAVRVWKITRAPVEVARNAVKLEALEAKLEAGEELTGGEKNSLTKLRKTPARPTARGPAEASAKGVIHGGAGVSVRKKMRPNPNLLAGRDRHFGAKIAHPGEVFERAVDQAVAEKLAEINGG